MDRLHASAVAANRLSYEWRANRFVTSFNFYWLLRLPPRKWEKKNCMINCSLMTTKSGKIQAKKKTEDKNREKKFKCATTQEINDTSIFMRIDRTISVAIVVNCDQDFIAIFLFLHLSSNCFMLISARIHFQFSI